MRSSQSDPWVMGAVLNGIARNVAQKLRKAKTTLKLVAQNRLSGGVVTADGGPVVSMTTYGKRARTVYLTLESIARGEMKPSRLILWLDEERLLERPPRSLKRLQKRGLEILRCENLGPHKKYYPYITSHVDAVAPLVTADDDVLYPKMWLSRLAELSEAHPTDVICFRARAVSVDSETGELEPYSQWNLCRSTVGGPHVFPTGTSGVLYPACIQDVIRAAGDGSQSAFRFVDDVWLHSKVIAAGFSARQVSADATHFPTIFLSQRDALFRRNVYAQENDERVRLAYTSELIALISTSERHAQREELS